MSDETRKNLLDSIPADKRELFQKELDRVLEIEVGQKMKENSEKESKIEENALLLNLVSDEKEREEVKEYIEEEFVEIRKQLKDFTRRRKNRNCIESINLLLINLSNAK